MKKLLSILVIGVLLTSCTNRTTTSQDIQMLQTIYPTVYNINNGYVCIDSTGTYHVRVTLDGQIYSIVKIK